MKLSDVFRRKGGGEDDDVSYMRSDNLLLSALDPSVAETLENMLSELLRGKTSVVFEQQLDLCSELTHTHSHIMWGDRL